MDNIEELKEDNIISSSINLIAYILYNRPQDISIVEDRTGYKMFCIAKTLENMRIMEEYKSENGENCFVELSRYNKIIKMLKMKSKYYKSVEELE